ncbi:MAG TPA: YncE family protein [Pyrinomonadaceae bacterium]|nr:YncE family protein [Pyrinomonadaceae bacterium]
MRMSSVRKLKGISGAPLSALARAIVCGLALSAGAGAQVVGPAAPKTAADASKAPAAVRQQVEKEGVRIDFSLVPVSATGDAKPAALIAGADARVTFRVTDARTGQPISNLHPNAWFSARLASAEPTTDAQCKDKIRTFMGGLLSARADLDLNNYLLLTLNHDRTLTFTNPQVAFSKTKLESIVELPGAGADFVLGKNKELLYITVPDQSAVVVVNTITRKLVQTIRIEGNRKPMRIALEPGGGRVWVGLDDSPLVAVIDTATGKLLGTVGVGAGLHNITFTADGALAYVTNSTADTVTAINTRTLARVADLPTGKTPVPVAYSTASRLVYVASLNGGNVTAIDPATQKVAATIPLARGIVALAFEPRGRYGFAVNQLDSNVTVFDAATNRIVGGTNVVRSPDQVVFTNRYAYVRGTASEKFSLIELDAVGKAKVTAVDVQAGQRAPSEMPAELGVANMIVPTPEGNSVMIAHAPDTMTYFYVEGMMAPMGTLSNYKRRARGLLLLDRSLTETAPGAYETIVKLGRAGSFDVPVLINETRIAHCFRADVGKSPTSPGDEEKSTIVLTAAFAGQEFSSGGAGVPLRFKITDSISKQPITNLQDVQILVFEPPGVWQQRQWAKEVGAGEYEITQVFPRAGVYNVMVRVSSRGVTFADLPFTPVVVKDGGAAGQKQPGQK